MLPWMLQRLGIGRGAIAVAPIRQLASKVDADFVKQLGAIVGEKECSVNDSIIDQHANDEGPHEPLRPDVVVFAQTTEHVSAILKLCNSRKIPVIPFGRGSGLEGGCCAPFGGVSLDLSKMEQVLEVNVEDFDCQVEAGLTWQDLNKQIRDTGLMFPVDPGAHASLGGMCATGASGTNAVRYGTMRQNAINCTVILPDGRVLETRGVHNNRPVKSSAGYDLTRLFIGSEGTLGVITRARLRLHPIPEACISAVVPFKDMEGAVTSVVEVLQMGINIARIEFLDDMTIRACNQYNKDPAAKKLDETFHLFLEFHGSHAQVQQDISMVQDISKNNGSLDFQFAEEQEARNRLWKARHEVLYATGALKANSECLTTDVCVPISKLPKLMTDTKQAIVEAGIIGTVVGHVGDGNFHTMLLFERNNKQELDAVIKIAKSQAIKAIEMGGTCTGEHGIGLGKMTLLQKEIGDVGIELIRSIKKAIDPNNIMNPGKIIK